MVQYVLTPWRDRQELLLVRRQFYPAGSSPSQGSRTVSHDHHQQQPHSQQRHGDVNADDDRRRSRGSQQDQQAARARQQQHKAVARVSMWVQRGNCPHMVESTALLMAALLSDEEQQQQASKTADDGTGASGVSNAMASSAYAVRAAYSTAFSRFVTGLLDGQQDKQRKQSMYSLAKTVGLPATFVELRHQSTHEQLPSLAQLRSAARRALDWIWDYYWKNLSQDQDDDDLIGALTCEEAVKRYLRLDDDDGAKLVELRSAWDDGQLLACVDVLKASALGNQAYLKCVSLARQLEDEEANPREGGQAQGLELEGQAQTSVQTASGRGARSDPEPEMGASSTKSTGWSAYQGTWTPKPIGIV